MNHTQNFGLNKPLPDEFYDIEKQNENMDRIDEALKEVKDKAEDSTGSIPEFVQAETRENIKNGETTGRLFGKIARFFADLKPVAFSGSYSDLSNKPNIPSVPDSVKNPHPLSINGHSYDGSAAINAGTIGITYGGTGATTAEAARTNLGLGTAATQEIANNLTTTEAGYALDARQGKVLWDEVGEINSNLGGNQLIYNESEDAYYIQNAGADTGLKKLGEPKIHIHYDYQSMINSPVGGSKTWISTINGYIVASTTWQSNAHVYVNGIRLNTGRIGMAKSTIRVGDTVIMTADACPGQTSMACIVVIGY